MTKPSGTYVRFAVSLFPSVQLTAKSKLSYSKAPYWSGVARSDSILTPGGTYVTEQNPWGGGIGAQDLRHSFRIYILGKIIDEKQAELYKVFSSHKNI